MDNHEGLAQALDEARGRAGLSYSQVVGLLRDKLGVYALGTVEGVRNYHRPEMFPKRPDLIQIAALADIYGMKVEDLSPSAALALDAIRDSVRRDAWSSLPA